MLYKKKIENRLAHNFFYIYDPLLTSFFPVLAIEYKVTTDDSKMECRKDLVLVYRVNERDYRCINKLTAERWQEYGILIIVESLQQETKLNSLEIESTSQHENNSKEIQTEHPTDDSETKELETSQETEPIIEESTLSEILDDVEGTKMFDESVSQNYSTAVKVVNDFESTNMTELKSEINQLKEAMIGSQEMTERLIKEHDLSSNILAIGGANASFIAYIVTLVFAGLAAWKSSKNYTEIKKLIARVANLEKVSGDRRDTT